MSTDVRMFSYHDLQKDVTSEDMVLLGNTDNFIAFHDGYIREASVELSDTVTAGTINLVLTINGAVIANTNLNLTLNVGNPNRHYRVIAQNSDFSITQGDLLGFQVTTNSALLPISRELNAIMRVEYTS